jgi:hypothetical protein
MLPNHFSIKWELLGICYPDECFQEIYIISMSELDPFNHADCWVYCDASQDGMATRSKF